MGLADALVEDSIDEIASAVRKHVLAGKPAQHRSEQVQLYRERIAALYTSKQIDPMTLRAQWSLGGSQGGAR
jgi:malonate decarboxylase beta subunit